MAPDQHLGSTPQVLCNVAVRIAVPLIGSGDERHPTETCRKAIRQTPGANLVRQLGDWRTPAAGPVAEVEVGRDRRRAGGGVGTLSPGHHGYGSLASATYTN